MSPKKAYLLMLSVSGILSLVVVGMVFGGVSVLKGYSNKLVDAKLENRILEEQQTSLVTAKKAIDTYTDLNQISKAVVPQDKDQAQTVRNISLIASDLGIKLSAINFPVSTLGQSQKTSPKKTGVTQVKPVTGLPKVFEMEITVQSDTDTPISYDTFLDFLSKLENNRRTSQVSNITILPSATDRTKLTFNLVLSTYIKP